MNAKTAKLMRKATDPRQLKDVKRWYRGLPWPLRTKARVQMKAEKKAIEEREAKRKGVKRG